MEGRAPAVAGAFAPGWSTLLWPDGPRALPASTPHGASEIFMARALALARRGLGCTSPNPAVGAVLERGGRIVGEGYHRRAGLPHAEVDALKRAGRAARGATLYVTLEPCNHAGRTPPCTDALLAAGVSRVVVATPDPNPVTDGQGIRRLRRAGIAVTVGVRADEARALNLPFEKRIRSGLPYVVAKAAQSLDGKIATARGESRWISSEASRREAHAWRSRVDAVMVGISTVLADDPRLTARGAAARLHQPIRVVVDSRLRIPLSARCLARGGTAIVATTISSGQKARALARRGVEVLRFPASGGRVPLTALCRRLATFGVASILLEGGGELLGSAFDARLVDQVAWFVAPAIVGGRAAPGAVAGAGVPRLSEWLQLDPAWTRLSGPDLYVQGRVQYAKR